MQVAMDPLHALIVRLVHMLLFKHPQNVLFAVTMNFKINQNKCLALKLMKVTIVLVQQQKSYVRRVKQEVVAVPCVKIVQKDFFKEEQVKQNVIAAPSAGVTRAMDRPVATQYHRGHTH